MNLISNFEHLNGGNYSKWAEQVEMALALADIDLAVTTPCPIAPVAPVRGDSETAGDWQETESAHAVVQMKYDLEKAKGTSSNRKCLMVIKSSIVDTIRGAIPDAPTVVEYLMKVESQFVGSSKAYAQTLIQRLVVSKYIGGGIREHILKMNNMASKLPVEMKLLAPFIVHLVLASLPREFETFVVNYNISPEQWDLEKLIAMCVQEEERLKASHGDSLSFVKHNNKRKDFQDKVAKPQGKPRWEKGSSSHAPSKAPKKDQPPAEKDECYWCCSKEHRKKDCPAFLKHCIKKGEEDLVTFIDETLYFSYEKSTWWIDSGATVHVANSLQGTSTRRILQRGERWLKVANGVRADAEAIGVLTLDLSNGSKLIFMYPLCLET